jgi:hypothetical protein
MDYLVALEAEDGTWYDDPEAVVGINKARLVANAQTLPKGYAAVIYELKFVETVKEYSNASATADSPKGASTP